MYKLHLYRLIACAIWTLLAIIPTAAQQAVQTFDAQQERRLFKATAAQQAVVFEHLIPNQTYSLTVPESAPGQNPCMPNVSIRTPGTQVISSVSQAHQLTFIAATTTVEVLLSYPCTWDEGNEPLHYLSLENLSKTASRNDAIESPAAKVIQLTPEMATPQAEEIITGPEETTRLYFYMMQNSCNSWTVSGAPSWVTVGYSGNLNVSIHVSPNTTDYPRTANVSISGCGNTFQYIIQQRGAIMEVVNESAETLVRDIFVGGDCMDVSNITFSGSGQIGRFTNGLGSIDMSTGIILSTGDIAIAPGPNDQDGATGGGGSFESDIELQSITTGSLFDKSVIEFDFVPTQSTVSFEYVFASEEYCEYVNTAFSDVFGLFISGPGINGTRNLALVPGGNTPVGLNTVNHMVNPLWYVPNTPAGLNNCENGGNCGCLSPQTVAGLPGTEELQYDGFTKKLTATIAVTPCATYHLKMAIANVGDGIFDSALFLKAGLTTGSGKAAVNWVVNGDEGVNEAVEGCSDVALVIDRLDSNNSQPLPVTFAIGGTATNGADYGPITNTYVIPAGANQLTVPVNIVNDGITEGAQTVILTLNNTCSCLNPQETLTIVENTVMTPVADTVYLCGPDVTDIGVNVDGGAPPYSFQWSNGSTDPYTSVFSSTSTTYTVTITDACGITATARARVNILPPATAIIQGAPIQLCPGQTGQILINFSGVGPFDYAYQINGVIQSTLSGIPGGQYSLIINQPGLYQGVSLVDANGCPGSVAGALLATNSSLTLSGITFAASCHNVANGSINSTVTGGQGPYHYDWTGPSAIGNIPDPVNILPGNYNATVTDAFGCTAIQTFVVNAPQCQWTVYPTGRNHTIILPATLSSDLEFPLQPGDLIGAFYDSSGTYRCAGYGEWTGVASSFAVFGNDATPPVKNGFNSLDVFKIRVWRAALNQEFEAAAQYAPVGTLGIVTHTNKFADDGISMINALSTAVKHPLQNGWNMISSYIEPVNPDMLEIFSPIAASINIVKDGDGNSMIPAFQINNIGDWDIRQGYQVKTSQADTLYILGPRVIPQNVPIDLEPGWQIIGYLLDRPQRIDSVFNAIKSQILLVKDNQGKVYSPQFGINTIGEMQPCQGYKVNAASNVTLTYHTHNFAPSADDRAEEKPADKTDHFVLNPALNTGNNATILITPEHADNLVGAGDEIGVFNAQGLLCGKGTFQNQNLAITVWGDDPGTPAVFEGMLPGEPYRLKVWRTADHQEFEILSNLQRNQTGYDIDAIELLENIQIGSPLDEAFKGNQMVEVYPNPASDNLNINIRSTESGQVRFELIGVHGLHVLETERFNISAGENNFSVPVPAQIVAGMYWLKCRFENGVVNRLVGIKKSN